MAENMDNPVGRPLLFDSPEQLQKKIDKYFADCDKGKQVKVYDRKKQEMTTQFLPIPYTVTGLALALGTSRQTLINYGKREEFFDTIERAKLRCENYAELLLLDGSVSPGGPQFSLKNNYGWKDKSEVDQNVTQKQITIVRNEDAQNEEESGDE